MSSSSEKNALKEKGNYRRVSLENNGNGDGNGYDSHMSSLEIDDPHAPLHKTNVTQTFLHLVKGYIGPGCLSQPWAYTQIGIQYGVMATIILGILTTYNCLIVMRRKVQFADEFSGSHVTYSDVGELAYGLKFRLYVSFSVCIQQLSVCTVYFSFISDNIAAVASSWDWPKLLQEQRFIMALVFPFILALCFIKDLRRLSPVTAAGTFFLFSSFAFLAACGFENWGPVDKSIFMPTSFQFASIPLATCAIMYSYEGICLIFPIEAAMIEPQKFERVFVFSMMCVIAIFTLFASFCVLAFGEIDDGSITAYLMSRLEEYDWNFSILAANTLVSLCVLLTYPLQMFPAIDLLSKIVANAGEHKFVSTAVDDDDADFEDDDSQSMERDIDNDIFHWDSVLRLGLVFLTFVLALSVPNVQQLISLAGALSGSSVALIIPPLLEIKFLQKDGESKLSAGAFKCYFLLFAGILYGVVGTTTAIVDIINHNEDDIIIDSEEG